MVLHVDVGTVREAADGHMLAGWMWHAECKVPEDACNWVVLHCSVPWFNTALGFRGIIGFTLD